MLPLLLALRLSDPAPVESLRLQLFDAWQRLWPRAASNQVLIVGIDETSLAEIGQWPWPRTIVADIVHRLAAAGASVIGINVLFAEPDRTSPPVVARQLRELPDSLRAGLAALPDHDAALALAFAQAPVVLGEVSLAQPTSNQGSSPASRLAVIGPDPAPFLRRHAGRLGNLPLFERVARGEGNFDLVPEVDGKARRIPLVTMAGGRIVPAFAAEVVRVAWGETTSILRTTATGIDGLLVGNHLIPTDERGRVWVHYAGTSAARRIVPARAVLAGEVPPGQIAGRIVLLGATAAGLADVRPTPLSRTMLGVEIHAQLIETILASEGLIRPYFALGLELLLTAVGGILVLALGPRLGALATLALGGGTMAAVLAATLALYLLSNVLIDPSFAALGGFVLWSVTAYQQYLREERARRQAAGRIMLMRQEAVLAGQMQQAILPRRFPSLTDLALHAEAHPAAEVGGDFYDVFELPGGRLAFLIADVSGKGMAAALFMAVAHTVVRATAPAAADDPALCLTRANALLAADNEAVMFVTLFYGILDPTSRVLDYANAGHNPPLLVPTAGTVRPLELIGDPPLGVLEEFDYSARSMSLAEGDTLFLYTDGVTEAFAADGRAYGEDRLRRQLKELHGLDPRRIIERVVADVESFIRGAAPSDDLTCLAVTVGATRHDHPEPHR